MFVDALGQTCDDLVDFSGEIRFGARLAFTRKYVAAQERIAFHVIVVIICDFFPNDLLRLIFA
jgi:hypothetical protein